MNCLRAGKTDCKRRCVERVVEKGKAVQCSLVFREEFWPFFPVFMHLGNECIYSVIFFFRAKIPYELNAHFFVVDILRKLRMFTSILKLLPLLIVGRCPMFNIPAHFFLPHIHILHKLLPRELTCRYNPLAG